MSRESEAPKCMMVVAEELPAALTANPAGVLAVTLGRRAGFLVGPDVVDGSGQVHAGLIQITLPILNAPGLTIKQIKARAGLLKGVLIIDLLEPAQTAHTYQDYVNEMSATLETSVKRFDLMHSVNARGTFVCTQACLSYLLRAESPHLLNIRLQLNIEARWFAPHLAYTMAKYGRSMCVLGMAEEFRPQGVVVNGLWPRTLIVIAAVKNLLGGESAARGSRRPEIMADAAHHILTRLSREVSGIFFIGEDVLRAAGVRNFDCYAVALGADPMPDLFL